MIKLLKKYYREMAAYSSALVKNPKTPKKKFIVFFRPRAGSNLVVDLINSHPEVYCDGEIFGVGYVGKVLFPTLYLKGRWFRANNKNVYGYKINHNQIINQGFDPKTFLSDLHQQDWKIIYTERVNSLRQAASFLIAEKRKEWVGTAENQLMGKVPIDCHALVSKIERLEKAISLEKELLAPFPYLHLAYETDLLSAEQHQATFDRVFEFLGLESLPVKTKRVKTAASHNLADVIENYDEVESFVSQTKFAKFLNQP